MKNLITLLFTIVLTLALTTSTLAQTKPACEKNDAGKVGLVFLFNGLDNLGVTPFNGGIGAKYYLSNIFVLRGSVGGFYSKTDEQSSNRFSVSGATLWEVLKSKNTTGYIGAELAYSKAKISERPEISRTSIGGILGGEFEVFQNVALGAEYKIQLANQSNPDAWKFSVGENTASFILNIYF